MKVSPHFSSDYQLLSKTALETALHRVPAYQHWRTLDDGPTAPIDKRFSALPVISKRDLRQYSWRNFVPNGLDINKAMQNGSIELVNTSGTTQERVTNVWYQPWWNESEAASWHYNIHTATLPLGNHKEAILTSPLNTGILSENGLLAMKERIQGRFLYLNEKANPALWDDNIIRRIIREMEIFQPVVLEANPSYLAKVALYAARHNLPAFQPGVIILTYENPDIMTRKQIMRTYSAPLASSYGSTEAGYVLMECEKGKMHQVSSSCRIDIEYLRPEHGQPNIGRLLTTTLTNPWRSLIRFDAGDLVEIDEGDTCACGRNDGYIFREVAGRTANLTYSTDGHPVTTSAIETAVAGIESILEYQIIQQAGQYDVHIVLDIDIAASSSLRDEIVERLLPLYGRTASIRVHFVDQIQAETSGKYRRTRSDITPDDNKLFLKGSCG
jgi:phenylacetate-coenzyme A ligase PaaK-like adenylate-forming protein